MLSEAFVLGERLKSETLKLFLAESNINHSAVDVDDLFAIINFGLKPHHKNGPSALPFPIQLPIFENPSISAKQ